MEENQGKDPRSYRKRDYRQQICPDRLLASEAKVVDTDLQIFTDQEIGEMAIELVLAARLQIEDYIGRRPDFLKTLIPLGADRLAPPLVRQMMRASRIAGVGPMAAVAGSIAQSVGENLLQRGCGEVVVENGGDIYMNVKDSMDVAVFAGASSLSMKLGIRIAKEMMPLGVCTSSATVGHSLSLGSADSVTVLSHSTALADAAATRLGNEVIDGDIQRALAIGQEIEGLEGILIVCGDKIGAVGQIELVGVG